MASVRNMAAIEGIPDIFGILLMTMLPCMEYSTRQRPAAAANRTAVSKPHRMRTPPPRRPWRQV